MAKWLVDSVHNAFLTLLSPSRALTQALHQKPKSSVYSLCHILWLKVPFSNKVYLKYEMHCARTSPTGLWSLQHLLGNNSWCRVVNSFCAMRDYMQLHPADNTPDLFLCDVCLRKFQSNYSVHFLIFLSDESYLAYPLSNSAFPSYNWWLNPWMWFDDCSR